MKSIRQLILTAISAFFVIAAVMLSTSASPKVTGPTSPSFEVAPQASTGLAPYAVELADMDGDEDLDFVTSNLVDQEFSTVSVAKNNGDGTFAPPVHYPVGPNPTDLRLADFNGDGKPDVVCLAALSGDFGESYVTVLFNDGIGGLINRHDYPVGENANSGGVDVGDYEVVEKGALVNSIYHFPAQMTFFTTPELLEIGGLPFVTPFEKPTRAEGLKYYRRVSETYSLRVRLGESPRVEQLHRSGRRHATRAERF